MAKSSQATGALVLHTYEDLHRKAGQFAAGAYGLLICAGRAGVSKSHIFKAALTAAHGTEWCLIEGNASPWVSYTRCYTFKDRPIQIDDADALHTTPEGKRLLKQLCQTDPVKRISWESRATQGKNAPAPMEFSTSSHVCIITNEWEFGGQNAHTAALEDRGHCYTFEPSPMEVHRYTATWYWDQEIHDYVGSHLGHFMALTCRVYLKAWEQKAAGDDWRLFLRAHMYPQGSREFGLLSLLDDPRFTSNIARAREFERSGLGSRATFYRHLQSLERNALEVEVVRCQGAAPLTASPTSAS